MTGVELVVVNGVPLYGTPERLEALHIPTEALEVCGQQRALNRDALPAGPFVQVTQRLSAKMKAAGVELAPLAECIK